MQLVETKSILAKLLATENLYVEQQAVPTASFDVKNRILTLPILDKNISADLYDLFVGHEVGHALWTPLEGMKKAKEEKLNMSIVNVVEDSRIERKIKSKYPGLRNSFLKGYTELIEKDFFETSKLDINEMNLVDRINLHCKGGALQFIQFTPEERQLLKEVESTDTYEEVITVSKKLMDVMREQEKEQEKQKQKPKGASAEGEEGEQYESGDDQSGQQPQESSDDKQNKKQTKGNANNDDDSGEEGESTNQKEIEGRGEYDNDQKVEDNLKSFTDEAFKRNEQKLIDTKARGYTYLNIPDFDPKSITLDYKQFYAGYQKHANWLKENYSIADEATISHKEFKKMRTDTNKVVSYLVKEFELRKNADQLKRASTAKTGDLNLNKIFSYEFNEDIFKKVTVMPGGKSHGLVMFIDWSGSMHNHMHNTVKQLISLVMFCKKVNIPYEVFAFADHDVNIDGLDKVRQNPVKDDLVIDNFKLLNIFSSRMTANEFMLAGAVMVALGNKTQYAPEWMRLGSTPLNQAIISCFKLIPEFQKKYKLQTVNTVFLTDGEGDTLSCSYQQRSNGTLTASIFNGYMNNFKSAFVRDPVTKHQEKIENTSSSRQQTEAFIKLLKQRTKCNILGFYMLSSREFASSASHFFRTSDVPYNHDLVLSKKNEFRKNKSVVSVSSGFDEYYFIRSESRIRNEDDEDELEISPNATAKSMANAFSKFTANKMNNRAVLNRFIGMIT